MDSAEEIALIWDRIGKALGRTCENCGSGNIRIFFQQNEEKHYRCVGCHHITKTGQKKED